jgi:hypothetical protein
LEGEVQFKNVAFDHKVHFEDLKRGKQLQCTSCHSQIVQGEHITVTESTCFICHFKASEHYPKIQDCSHCHKKEYLIEQNASHYNHSIVFDKGFTCDKCHSQTIIGDGNVPRENCYKCHWEQERLKKYGETELMHREHIFINKIECSQCHMEIQHKIITDVNTIADCKTCHIGIHRAQKILYTGEGGKGIQHSMPNIMLERGLSCKGCHIFHEETGGKIIKGDTLFSEGEACDSCHGAGYSRLLRDWESSTIKKLNRIKSIYNRAVQEVRKSRGDERKKAESMIQEAEFNIEVVDRGKSVHNISFSQVLLQASYNKIIDALKLCGSLYQPESFVTHPEEIPTKCATCHAGIEENRSEIFGLDFPHKNHLIEQKIQCDTCHSNTKKHGEFTATKQSCSTCHHKDTKKECTSCHQLQKTFYQGGEVSGLVVPKDIMFEAGAECSDCHGEGENIKRPDKSSCLECHDEGYDDMHTEWQSSVEELSSTLGSLLKTKKKLNLSEQEKTDLTKIEQILQKIKTDGSSGIHNYMFVEETLTGLIKQLEAISGSNTPML